MLRKLKFAHSMYSVLSLYCFLKYCMHQSNYGGERSFLTYLFDIFVRKACQKIPNAETEYVLKTLQFIISRR